MVEFPPLWARDLDLDIVSGHTAHRHASLSDIYLHIKCHWNRRNFLWADGRTDRRTDILYPLYIMSTRRSRPKNLLASVFRGHSV